MSCKGCDEEKFEEYLDEIYGNVSICGYEYPAGQALREVDPIAFRVCFADEECDCEDEEED